MSGTDRAIFALPLFAALFADLIAAMPAAGAGPLRERLKARIEAKQAEESRFIDPGAIVPGATRQTLSYGPDALQAIDVYSGPNTRNAPVIVMVHGGAWTIGDKANTGSIENKLKYWLPKGYVFVSVNYRMLPEVMAFEQAEDVAAAMRFVQAHAGDWGGRADGIVLIGHSAGAHIVALLSSKPDMVGRPWAATVALDSAVMRVSETMTKRHPRFYDDAFGADPAYWTRASPMDQWTPAAVPMMIVCSSQRKDRPCDQAHAFAAKAKAAGKAMPVLPQNLSHADINRTLGQPSAYTSAVDAFIHQALD